MSNKPPIEVPQGAIRLNTDSQKLEFFAQDRWYEMATNVPNLGDATNSTDASGGARGLIGGGSDGRTDATDYITVSTAGNGQDFGNLTQSRDQLGAGASRTRGIFAGGYTPSHSNRIDRYEISTLGNAIDFGNLTLSRKDLDSCSNQTRIVHMGGRVTPSNKNNIDYNTIASDGDALDYGDLTATNSNHCCYGNAVRGIMHGGFNQTMEFITIPTLGNAQDFGEAVTSRLTQGAGCSSSTRGMAMGGGTSDSIIDYVTIATLGNATRFGDLYNGTGDGAGLSNCVRGVLAGGRTPSPETNIIQYINISTEGDSIDFGDLSYTGSTRSAAGLCNAHGGL